MWLFSNRPGLAHADCYSWGQDGGRLSTVCQSSAVDVVVLSFLNVFFGPGGDPEVNFASSCPGPYFPGTKLLQCSQIGSLALPSGFADSRQDIQTCQNLGKVVLLGLGGAIGTYGFSDSSEASAFAATLWEMFGEGWGSTRPFGWVTVDGFNLGIELFEAAPSNRNRY